MFGVLVVDTQYGSTLVEVLLAPSTPSHPNSVRCRSEDGTFDVGGTTKVRDAQNTMRLRTHRGARFLLAVAVFDLTRFDSPHHARPGIIYSARHGQR